MKCGFFLPAPADGKRFTSAALLTTGRRVALDQTKSAVTLTLQDGWWDPVACCHPARGRVAYQHVAHARRWLPRKTRRRDAGVCAIGAVICRSAEGLSLA
jgi:hypothetical protein